MIEIVTAFFLCSDNPEIKLNSSLINAKYKNDCSSDESCTTTE